MLELVSKRVNAPLMYILILILPKFNSRYIHNLHVTTVIVKDIMIVVSKVCIWHTFSDWMLISIANSWPSHFRTVYINRWQFIRIWLLQGTDLGKATKYFCCTGCSQERSGLHRSLMEDICHNQNSSKSWSAWPNWAIMGEGLSNRGDQQPNGRFD